MVVYIDLRERQQQDDGDNTAIRTNHITLKHA